MSKRQTSIVVKGADKQSMFEDFQNLLVKPEMAAQALAGQ